MTQPEEQGDPAPRVSVVVPVYGCADTLRPLYERVRDVLEAHALSFEIVFVDDRSCDRQWEVMRELALADPRVHAIRFSRNFGQHVAISAAIQHARGDWIVPMDCDLQDPPEVIPRLIEATRDGAEIVLAQRKRNYQSIPRRLASALYFRVLSWLTGNTIDGTEGTFSAISRHVAHAYAQFRDLDRHYLMILRLLGFATTSIPYDRDTRNVGRSSYSFRKLVTHALSGIMFSTTSVLHWVVGGGMVMSFFALVLGSVFIALAFLATPPPGWTSLAVLQLFVGGAIMISVGVVGIYVGKTFEQVRDRPLWIVERTIQGGLECRPGGAECAALPPATQEEG